LRRRTLIGKPSSFRKKHLDTYARNLGTTKQSYTGAQANEQRAQLASSSQIGEVNTQVARLQTELSDAQYDLDQTVVRASNSGFVTQVAVTAGVYVVQAPFRPAMTFVNSAPQKRALGAAFQQNVLQRVRVGDEAEIAFKAVPGRVFKGKVRILLDATLARCGRLVPCRISERPRPKAAAEWR
jgi:multidrug resistance efflux pump